MTHLLTDNLKTRDASASKKSKTQQFYLKKSKTRQFYLKSKTQQFFLKNQTKLTCNFYVDPKWMKIPNVE